MKKNNRPAKKAAPAKKAENTKSVNQRTFEVHIKRLSERGMSKEDIYKKLHEEDTRLILCIAYDSYKLDAGTIKITRGVKKKEVEKHVILYGIKAIKHVLNENKVDMIDGGHNYVYILTKKDKVDEITNLVKDMGRVSVRKWEDHYHKPKKDKKPTNNTAEAKTAAKNTRKDAKKKAAEMRPYYAALRKGGVSERIKKHNKALAEKIEAWLKTMKNKDDGHDQRQKTTLERKTAKKMRIQERKEAALKRVQERQKKQMEKNQAAREKAAQKAGKQAKIEFKNAA